MDFDDDFLGGGVADTATVWRDAVEPVRGELLDWAAAALRARVPTAAAYRGPKGTLQCRQDLDRHLKHVLAEPHGDLVAYRRWALQTMYEPRGQGAADLAAGAAVLAEAVLRFAAQPAATAIAMHVTETLHSALVVQSGDTPGNAQAAGGPRQTA